MRILLHTNNFLPIIGGAEIVIHNLAEGLVELGHDVIVSTFQSRYPNPVANYEIKRLKNIHGMTRLGVGAKSRQFVLKRFIKRIEPDIIHTHFSIPSGVEIAEIKNKISVPIILTCHGEDIQKVPEISYGYRLNPDKEAIIKTTVNRFDKLIAISDDIKREYLSLGVSKNKIVRCPNPINYNLLQNKSNRLRTELGIDSQKKIILAVGRNHQKKGFKSLINIIDYLVNQLNEKNILCIIVGKEVSKLSEIIEKKDLNKYFLLKETAIPVGIKFQNDGYIKEDLIETYFKTADIYAMTSIVESFGLVTIEAMASGLPIIGYDSPGTNELIINNENGIIVEKNNEYEFAKKIKEIVKNDLFANYLKNNAQKTALNYSRIAIAKKHLEVYKIAISRYNE